jgi:hypothetical protein
MVDETQGPDRIDPQATPERPDSPGESPVSPREGQGPPEAPRPRPSLPTPVRVLMQAGGDGPEAPAAATAAETEEPPASPVRTLRAEDQVWKVRSVGSVRSGTGPDAGAPLLLLTFAREEAPEVPVRERLGVGVSLDDLSDDDLLECLERSRPVRAPSGRPD